jgi:ubiquinone biosynthesis protein UbiJ
MAKATKTTAKVFTAAEAEAWRPPPETLAELVEEVEALRATVERLLEGARRLEEEGKHA